MCRACAPRDAAGLCTRVRTLRELPCLSFSYDRMACTLYSQPCDASQLRSPDSQHGWDAVSVSREHIRKLFGKSGKAMLALPTPHVGHCGPTQEGEEGDCLTGNNGNLPFGPGAPPNPMGILTEVDCVRMCAERCARCNYVSISERGHDCSWYHSCDLNALAMEPRWLKHKTYSVAAVKRADAKRFGAVPWDVKPPISQSPSTSLRVGSDDVGPARGRSRPRARTAFYTPRPMPLGGRRSRRGCGKPGDPHPLTSRIRRAFWALRAPMTTGLLALVLGCSQVRPSWLLLPCCSVEARDYGPVWLLQLSS